MEPEPERMPYQPLRKSLGQLWRQAPLWRASLLGATALAAWMLIYPPWQDQITAPTPTSQPASQPAVITHSGPASQPAVLNTQPASGAATPPAPATTPQPATRIANQANPQALTADQSCNGNGPMGAPIVPPPPHAGTITAFLSHQEATLLIPRSERMVNGKLDSRYTNNLRAVIHPDHAPPHRRLLIVIPQGMHVSIGQHIRYIGGHASPTQACHYIPNLAVGK